MLGCDDSSSVLEASSSRVSSSLSPTLATLSPLDLPFGSTFEPSRRPTSSLWTRYYFRPTAPLDDFGVGCLLYWCEPRLCLLSSEPFLTRKGTVISSQSLETLPSISGSVAITFWSIHLLTCQARWGNQWLCEDGLIPKETLAGSLARDRPLSVAVFYADLPPPSWKNISANGSQ